LTGTPFANEILKFSAGQGCKKIMEDIDYARASLERANKPRHGTMLGGKPEKEFSIFD
jgi:hypothetical protein